MPKPVPPLYIPARRTRWLEWQDDDDDSGIAFRAKVRADLTFGEIDTLVFEDPKTKTTVVHDAVAPFVLEWNVGTLNDEGEPEAVPAPAEAGGEVFQVIPNLFFWWLYDQLRNHSVKRPDPKPSAPVEATVAP